MSDTKKPSTGELYAQQQWSDNMSFSSKAMDESKKKTSQLNAEDIPESLVNDGQVRRTSGSDQGSLEHYVQEMNQEINRMSDAVGDRLDEFGNKITHSFDKVVKPLRSTVDHVSDNAGESLRNMRNNIGKAVLQEFTSVVKNLSTRVAGPTSAKKNTADAAATPQSSATGPTSDLEGPGTPDTRRAQASAGATAESSATSALSGQTERPQLSAGALEPASVNQPPAPAYTWHFGTILEQKIFFATIHNRPFLSERDIKEYNPEDAQQMHRWMERAVNEIKNCAPYGQKLPTPNKGLYANTPMYDILRQATVRDVERFLGFVFHRPQPFQQKALKLSEAFATWAHKGAPEK